MSKALISVVGPSGTGKSTSLRNLDPAITRILDLELKGLPFRNASQFQVLPCPNIASLDSNISMVLKDEQVKIVVIESFTKYTEQLMRLMQQSYKGYDVWANFNKQVGIFLDKIKNDHAVVILTAIDEIVKIPNVDGSEFSQRRIKISGKQWEGMIEKEMLMVLFTELRKSKETGKITYHFQTNTDGTTSSKTPMGMFEEQLVDNDMALVIKKAEEYYGKA